MDFLWVVEIILAVVLLVLIAGKMIMRSNGKENVVAKLDGRTPFAVVSQDGSSILLKTKVEFANEGTSSAMFVDCIVRTLLPYEQYDGIEASGKAERDGAPREDDYFEALIIEKKESAFVNILVKLTARKGMSLKEALSHMVDLPVEVIFMVTGRTPWHYEKARILLPAEEIAKLAGVKLAED